MARIWKWLTPLACGVLLLGGVTYKQATTPNHPLTPPGAEVTPEVAKLLGRACADCHSSQTRLPWYGHVPPVSFMLKEDIVRARKALDFSAWDRYTTMQKRGHLAAIRSDVQKRSMPIPAYMFAHPAARMTDAEVKLLADWAIKETVRLRKLKAVPAATASMVKSS